MRQWEVGRVDSRDVGHLRWPYWFFAAAVWLWLGGGGLHVQEMRGLGAAPEWLDQAAFESLFQEFIEPDRASEARPRAGESSPLVDVPEPTIDPFDPSTEKPPAVGVIERGANHRILRRLVDPAKVIEQHQVRLREVSGRLAESVSRDGVDLGVLAQDFSGEALGDSSLVLDLSPETKRALAMQNEVDFLRGQIEELRSSPEVEYQEHTELGSGMHYWSPAAQAWRESDPRIELVNGVAVARRGQQRVLFAPDLSSKGSVDISTPEGRRLKGTVLGLVYLDAASGRDVIIATVKPTLGELVGENQLAYVDAFEGVKADVVYTYERSGLEQDVVLKARLPDPARFGLDPDTTRLEVMTEFFDAREPEVSEQKLSWSSRVTTLYPARSPLASPRGRDFVQNDQFLYFGV